MLLNPNNSSSLIEEIRENLEFYFLEFNPDFSFYEVNLLKGSDLAFSKIGMYCVKVSMFDGIDLYETLKYIHAHKSDTSPFEGDFYIEPLRLGDIKYAILKDHCVIISYGKLEKQYMEKAIRDLLEDRLPFLYKRTRSDLKRYNEWLKAGQKKLKGLELSMKNLNIAYDEE